MMRFLMILLILCIEYRKAQFVQCFSFIKIMYTQKSAQSDQLPIPARYKASKITNISPDACSDTSYSTTLSPLLTFSWLGTLSRESLNKTRQHILPAVLIQRGKQIIRVLLEWRMSQSRQKTWNINSLLRALLIYGHGSSLLASRNPAIWQRREEASEKSIRQSSALKTSKAIVMTRRRRAMEPKSQGIDIQGIVGDSVEYANEIAKEDQQFQSIIFFENNSFRQSMCLSKLLVQGSSQPPSFVVGGPDPRSWPSLSSLQLFQSKL